MLLSLEGAVTTSRYETRTDAQELNVNVVLYNQYTKVTLYQPCFSSGNTIDAQREKENAPLLSLLFLTPPVPCLLSSHPIPSLLAP